MPPQRRLAAIVSTLMLALGLLYVGMTVAAVGLADGLRLAAHDPGKVFFHIVLLPLATGVFIARFPRELLSRLSEQRVWLLCACGVGVVMLVVGTGFVTQDFADGFRERIQSPPQFRPPEDNDARDELVDLYLGRNISPADPTGSRSIHLEAYRTAMDAARTHGDIRDASVRAWTGYALSWVGTMCTLALFSTLVLIGLTRTKISDDAGSGVLFATALLAIWLPLRAYSEWHNGFGVEGAVSSYLPLIVGVVLALAVFGLFFAVTTTPRRAMAGAGVLAALSFVAGAFGFIQPELFSTAAQMFANLTDFFLLAIYVIAGFFLLGFASWVSGGARRQP